MVFLDKNSEKTVITRHFPMNCVSLRLINNLTRQTFEYSNLEDTSTSIFFYEFALDLSALLDGEYTVILLGESGTIIEELMGICGNYQVSKVNYERQNNTRKVYERE